MRPYPLHQTRDQHDRDQDIAGDERPGRNGGAGRAGRRGGPRWRVGYWRTGALVPVRLGDPAFTKPIVRRCHCQKCKKVRHRQESSRHWNVDTRPLRTNLQWKMQRECTVVTMRWIAFPCHTNTVAVRDTIRNPHRGGHTIRRWCSRGTWHHSH